MSSSNPLVSGLTTLIPVVSTSTPVSATPWSAQASWAGTTHSQTAMVTEYFPRVDAQVFQAVGSGTYSLWDDASSTGSMVKGPRMSPNIGTVDVWLTAPVAGSARSAVLIGSSATTFAGADLGFIRIGVTSGNLLTCTIKNNLGVDVAVCTATTFGALVAGVRYNVKLSWNTTGLAKASINGTAVVPADFSVTPSTSWASFVPDKLNLYTGTAAPQWSGKVPLVQISSKYL